MQKRSTKLIITVCDTETKYKIDNNCDAKTKYKIENNGDQYFIATPLINLRTVFFFVCVSTPLKPLFSTHCI